MLVSNPIMANARFGVPSRAAVLAFIVAMAMTEGAAAFSALGRVPLPMALRGSSRCASSPSTALTMKQKATMSKFEAMRFKFGVPNLTAGAEINEAMVENQKGAGFDYSDFEEAVSKFDCSFQVGDTVVGQVVQYEQSGALVDVGGKSSAFLNSAEVSMQRVDDLEQFISIGDNREFQIIGGEDENGQVKLSVRRLEFARAWERVRQIQAEDCTITAEILSINRGGALVNFEGLRGFLPGSHAPAVRPQPPPWPSPCLSAVAPRPGIGTTPQHKFQQHKHPAVHARRMCEARNWASPATFSVRLCMSR